MGFEVKMTDDGRYDWTVWQSAYGLACGVEDTLAAAKVEMLIAEHDIMESPFPPAVVAVMRSDYERFAADYDDPPLAASGSLTDTEPDA